MRGRNYSKKVDVWSFGVMLSELLTLEQPYPEGLRVAHIMKGVLTGTLRPRLPRHGFIILWVYRARACVFGRRAGGQVCASTAQGQAGQRQPKQASRAG